MMRVKRTLPAVAMLLAMLLSGLAPVSVSAEVTQVKGSAYGYFSRVSVVGSTYTTGSTPTVTLPPGGSATPITNTEATGSATAGPARIFSSGRLDVSTQGTNGSTGSVTSSVTIQSVNTSGQEPFTAASVFSTCTASESGVTGSTTITNGTLMTDNGDDDPGNAIPDHPPVIVNLPTNPAPNTSYDGHTHIGNTTDSFRYVFNEQIVGPDGSLTVYAAHQYLLGPTAVGDLFIGQSVCGVTAAPDNTMPTVRITAPAAGAAVKEGARVKVAANDDGSGVKVVQVRYCRGTRCVFDNGKKVGADAAAPYVIRWRNQPKDGTYTLVAKATDRAGNAAFSDPVTVRVKN